MNASTCSTRRSATAETSGVVSLDDKISVAGMLDTLGIDYVEGGYPGANPTDNAFFETKRTKRATFTAFGMTKPTVIFVHHNLDADEDGALTDAGRLLEIVRPATNVKAIIYGHTHAWKHDKQDGIHLVNVPAVAYNFKDSEPIGWTDAYFSAKGGRLKLNAIGGNIAPNGEMLELPWRS